MQLKVDINAPCAVRSFSEQLAHAHEPVSIEIGDVEFCPNKIVPIVALADLHRRTGQKISFGPNSGGALEKAVSGFQLSEMNPVRGIDRPFGRVWRFNNSDELEIFVNAVEKELPKTGRFASGVRLCFLWCLNEVMDNVLRHSRKDGTAFGYVMVQYVDSVELLKACVFDVGIGFKESFVGSKYSPETPEAAIRLAVGENVTSDSGQGNGLYGLKCLVEQSPRGRLHIRSAGGEYLYETSTREEGHRPSWTLEGYPGTTTVDFQMRCDGELSFAKVFPKHQGLVDLWLEDHETEDDAVRITVREVVPGCGSRASGKEVRTLVENCVETEKRRVILDFENIDTCSSGFVDELIGKLVEKYGFVSYTQKISVAHTAGIVAVLINHSVVQRLALQESEQQVADSSGSSDEDGMDENAARGNGYKGIATTEVEEGGQISGVDASSSHFLDKTFKEEQDVSES